MAYKKPLVRGTFPALIEELQDSDTLTVDSLVFDSAEGDTLNVSSLRVHKGGPWALDLVVDTVSNPPYVSENAMFVLDSNYKGASAGFGFGATVGTPPIWTAYVEANGTTVSMQLDTNYGVTISGPSINLAGSVALNGDTYVDGTFDVSGSSTFQDNVHFYGDANVTYGYIQHLYVSGTTYRNGVQQHTSPTSGTVNNLSLGNVSVLRVSGQTGVLTITGMTGGSDGREVTIFNASTGFNINIEIENTGSSAANRFVLYNASKNTFIPIPAKSSMTFWYDATDSRWRQKI